MAVTSFLRTCSLLLLLYTTSLNAQLQCPPLGPVVPAPTNLAQNPKIQQLVPQANALLQNFTSSLNNTALTIGIKSIHDTNPLLTYYSTPAAFNKSGTSKVDGDTVFSIGSASKLFIALSVLQLKDKINVADPVVKYVPRLAQVSTSHDPLLAVNWSAVTVEALLSHLGGVPSDLALNFISETPGLTEGTGLPPLSSSDQSPACGGRNGPGCSWDVFFADLGKRPPVYGPATTPEYSNVGYSILGRVVENASGKTYTQYVQDAIFKPAGMSHSSVGAPQNTSMAFITAGSSWYGTGLGASNSSGGLYSSNNDLLRFGTNMLSSSLLSPADTRAWMKPRTFTSSDGVSVGRPWEIARGANLTSDGRIIDVYTKTGNLGDFTAILALIPDYDLVVAINMAGPDSSIAVIQVILSQLMEALMPAVDQVAKDETSQRCAGTYSSGTNSSITLSVDDFGILISNFSANGVEVPAAYAAISGASPQDISIRLYPSNLSSGNRTAWRAIYQTSSAADLVTFNSEVFFPQGSCQSWTEVDLTTYGYQALDYFVLEADGNGKVQTVEVKAWKDTLNRVAEMGW